MGKCWNEKDGKPRAFVLKEQKTCSACPWVLLLQTTNQTGFFVLLLNASWANVFFLKIIFCLSVFSGDRASLGLFIWPIHPIQKAAQAIFSRLISSTIPYGFATAKPLCLISKWKGQASYAVSSSPVPAGLSAGCRNSVRATAVRVVKHLCGDWQKLFWGSRCLLLWWWHGTW